MHKVVRPSGSAGSQAPPRSGAGRHDDGPSRPSGAPDTGTVRGLQPASGSPGADWADVGRAGIDQSGRAADPDYLAAHSTLRVDVLSAEIGSTMTVVSAFDGLTAPGQAAGGDATADDTLMAGTGRHVRADSSRSPAGTVVRGGNTHPQLIGQGSAPTTVDQGDVRIGLEAAIADLCRKLGVRSLEYRRFSACSSAAGGLRMSVHGLVYDMTVRAAREAALGAGANLVQVTAGLLRDADIRKLLEIEPNIIMIAGGLDYGERDTALANARAIHAALSAAGLVIPVIYAGNLENRDEITDIFNEGGFPLYLCENVYPKIDELNIEPAREVIQKVFEEHIVRAPGMEQIRELVNGRIMPVPGAVMHAARLLRERLGDLVVFDVGGATTDIHSVCEDSPEVERVRIAPEPLAKRTVEGDLGVYVNRAQVASLLSADAEAVIRSLGTAVGDADSAIRTGSDIAPNSDVGGGAAPADPEQTGTDIARNPDSSGGGRSVTAPSAWRPAGDSTAAGDSSVTAPGGPEASTPATLLAAMVESLPPVPRNAAERDLALVLTTAAARTALSRHAGQMRELFTMAGKQKVAEGKDLSAVALVIGTGGALTRLPGGETLVRGILSEHRGNGLYPAPESRVLLDNNYIMAAMGVLTDEFPDAAADLLLESLGVEYEQ